MLPSFLLVLGGIARLNMDNFDEGAGCSDKKRARLESVLAFSTLFLPAGFSVAGSNV